MGRGGKARKQRQYISFLLSAQCRWCRRLWKTDWQPWPPLLEWEHCGTTAAQVVGSPAPVGEHLWMRFGAWLEQDRLGCSSAVRYLSLSVFSSCLKAMMLLCWLSWSWDLPWRTQGTTLKAHAGREGELGAVQGPVPVAVCGDLCAPTGNSSASWVKTSVQEDFCITSVVLKSKYL